jgi:very-short-patch-repair endonuclease
MARSDMVEGSSAMTATDRAYKNARRLRRNLSLPEKLLWLRIKGTDVRFRRQHPIGAYILDFYCASANLAIEVDGMAHDMGDRPQRDATRTEWLASQGIEVLGIPARDVLADPDAIAGALLRLCAVRSKPLHHSPLASGPPPRPSAREELR